MGYVGAPTINEMQKRAKFVRITNAGLKEKSCAMMLQLPVRPPNYPTPS